MSKQEKNVLKKAFTHTHTHKFLTDIEAEEATLIVNERDFPGGPVGRLRFPMPGVWV